MANSRLAALRDACETAHVDGMIVFNQHNRTYISGFNGSAGVLIVDPQRSVLLTDGRYTAQATSQAPDFTIVTRGLTETLVAAVGREAATLNRIGYEPSTLTVSDFNALRDVLPTAEWVDMSGVVERVRAAKDADEVALLKRAIAITDAAFAQVRPLLRPTMREREAAWELHKAIIEHGGDGLAFEIIVGAGRNSALPHYHAGEALLGRGQPIVIDFGALYHGYHGDMTRTLILGETNARFDEIYGLVRTALETATNGITAGTSGQQADALARDVIANAGYGDAFSHGTGHGVGLFIHEEPRLSSVNTQPLPANSIFSIEPGIYLPDWGGVRLENLVYFDGTQVQTLSQSSLDPIVELND